MVEAAKLMSSGEIKQAASNEELVFAMRNVNVSTIFFVSLGQHYVSTARLQSRWAELRAEPDLT